MNGKSLLVSYEISLFKFNEDIIKHKFKEREAGCRVLGCIGCSILEEVETTEMEQDGIR